MPYDSSFTEYKFSNFKKKQGTYIEFPPELSLDFAKTLNPRRAGIIVNRRPDTSESTGGDGLNPNGVVLDPLNRTGQTAVSAQDSQSVMSKDASTGSRRIHTSSSLPALSKGVSFDAGTEKNRHGSLSISFSNLKDIVSAVNSGPATSSATAMNTPNLNRQNTTKSAVVNTPMTTSNKTAFSASELYADDEEFDFDDDDDENGGGRKKKAIKHIDFFRVCALCELRLPRNSVDFKVIRKHVVKLRSVLFYFLSNIWIINKIIFFRSSWDPALVSKEVRSLDNSISMYNLVYVCVFCAQYFDPDFPDGIAYPVRVSSKVRNDLDICFFVNLIITHFCCVENI